MLEAVRFVGVMIAPFMPGKAAALRDQLGLAPLLPAVDRDSWPDAGAACRRTRRRGLARRSSRASTRTKSARVLERLSAIAEAAKAKKEEPAP